MAKWLLQVKWPYGAGVVQASNILTSISTNHHHTGTSADRYINQLPRQHIITSANQHIITSTNQLIS
jgi:hypothetical protein